MRFCYSKILVYNEENNNYEHSYKKYNEGKLDKNKSYIETFDDANDAYNELVNIVRIDTSFRFNEDYFFASNYDISKTKNGYILKDSHENI